MAKLEISEANLVVNPDAEAHFMRIQDAGKEVAVLAGDQLLAETGRARRVIEFGHQDFLEPVVYLPKEDVRVVLHPGDKATHCPLKGDTTYFHTEAVGQQLEDIAWEYTDPYERAEALKGLVAFDPERVTIIERPMRD
ncbi:DUF427 domain-containing protein [Marinicauda algicola]|uniref:DUF427 domain-containing protein n=1 Tax=Marinicauda algicola TaxID=2029849 RepID=A0A4S2H471_9PROT|nr:DUF427 domain-containing protein [Marinicauda algicola]TGY90198.1 DUF427 domain-containing protein [Marinicauda algicola]